MSPRVQGFATRTCATSRPRRRAGRARLRRRLHGAAILLVLGSGPSAAMEADTLGRTLYLRYCSACHGQGGKGDGPVAPLIQPGPTDLTGLAARNHGQYPFLRLLRVVDGRETLRVHGDPDMPVWGEVFAAEENAGEDSSALAAGKVRLIVEYLEAIQER